MKKSWFLPWAGVCWLSLASLASAGPGTVLVGDATLTARVGAAGSVSVTVSGPDGFVLSRTFGLGEQPELDLTEGSGPLTDGLYLYDVRVAPAAGRQRGSDEVGQAALPGAYAFSGSFTIKAGSVEQPAREPGGRAPVPPQPDDQVIADDLIVQGSACAGDNCVDNEAFGLENLLLKQDSNRIRADDTNAPATGFPDNDWQIRFNDDNSGGLNRFAIEDLTAARIPLTIIAAAPSNSIFVDKFGRLGVLTGAPTQAIHVVTGDSPALRLEQDASGGFSTRTWDVAANEDNFFVRDVINGNKTPFRVGVNAPSNSIRIANVSGNVGMGWDVPTSSLHVYRQDGTAQLRVQEATAVTGSRNLLRMVNNGASTFRFDNTFNGSAWGFGSLGSGNFFIGSTPGQPLAMQVTPAGNMIITGTYSSTSDRAAKDDVNAVDPAAVLAKVAELPIATWRYKGDEATHVGPMAQDFYAAFGLGADDKHIAPTDMAGLGLAAIQALRAEVADKDARIRALEERLAKLEAAQKP